eukprot:9945378-Karenia_brevis.AAC.1
MSKEANKKTKQKSPKKEEEEEESSSTSEWAGGVDAAIKDLKSTMSSEKVDLDKVFQRVANVEAVQIEQKLELRELR